MSESIPSQEDIQQAADVLSRLSPGFLPKPLFEEITRLCVTPIVELVPLRNSTSGTEVLLFTRPVDDPVWGGKLHTPGTVLRATDVDNGIHNALDRIYKDELSLTPENSPVFTTTMFHKVKRGSELATVFYVDLGEQSPDSGSWYNASDLPGNLVDTQTAFITECVEAFNSQRVLK